MAVYAQEIKDDNGDLNYDRVEDLIRKYQSDVVSKAKTVDPTTEEKQIRQFTSRAIQISKGMYLKVVIRTFLYGRRIHLLAGTSMRR